MVELRTDRLLLRQWRSEDFEPFAAYYADEELSRFVGGISTREQSWRRLATYIGHWSLKGYGYWAVEELASARFIGAVGLWWSEGWPELELGYWLTRDGRGKGFATEAAGQARDYAFTDLKSETLVSYIHPDNVPSQRVAERLGGKMETTIELLGFGPHLVYRYSKPQ